MDTLSTPLTWVRTCLATCACLSHLELIWFCVLFPFAVSLTTYAKQAFLLSVTWAWPLGCLNFTPGVVWLRRRSWSSATRCRRRATPAWGADGPLTTFPWSPCGLWCSFQATRWAKSWRNSQSTCPSKPSPEDSGGPVLGKLPEDSVESYGKCHDFIQVKVLYKSRLLSPVSVTHLQNIFAF